MQINNTLAQELHNQMHIYIQQLQELEDTLSRERETIAKRDFEAFSRVLEHKNNLLTEVSHFDKGLTQLLQKTLKSPTNEIFEDLLERYKGPLAHGLRLQWAAIKRSVVQCRQANEINSKIVSHAQQHYARLLSIFRNEDPDATTYARNGRQSSGNTTTGRLAKA